LKAKGGLKWLVSGLPAIFMACMTIWALVINQFTFGRAHNPLLQAINFIILVIAVWIAIEGLVKFFSPGPIEEKPLPVTP
jgi:carbon starvation protein